jgi:hypothetical protein
MPVNNMIEVSMPRPCWTELSTISKRNSWPFPSPPRRPSLCYRCKSFANKVEMAGSLITSDPNARPEHFRNLFQECLFIFMVMMATASTTFLQGVIVINTATIGKDLRMTSAQVTWISAAIGYGSHLRFALFTNVLQSREWLFHALLRQNRRYRWWQTSASGRHGVP